jgi:hypothetical protein
MSFLLGLSLGGAALMWLIWSTPYPPARDPHMRAMDVLGDPIRLHDCGRFHRPSETCPDEHGQCWCGGALDERGVCSDRCARESWDR